MYSTQTAVFIQLLIYLFVVSIRHCQLFVAFAKKLPALQIIKFGM